MPLTKPRTGSDDAVDPMQKDSSVSQRGQHPDPMEGFWSLFRDNFERIFECIVGGQEKQPFGTWRIAFLKFFVTGISQLTKRNQLSIEKMIKNDKICKIFWLFVKFPNNNILHGQIESLFANLLWHNDPFMIKYVRLF
jgi:hypothetical protein